MQKKYCLESFYELGNCAIGTYYNHIGQRWIDILLWFYTAYG